MIKRFVLFTGRDDRPSGGWYDYVESFDTQDEAVRHLDLISPETADWWQIVDLKTEDFQIGRFQK